MPREFQKLSADEQQLMYDAIPLITILVAGADGKIDNNELEWAEKLIGIRSFEYKDEMRTYYEKVSAQFSDRLKFYNESFPNGTEAKTNAVSEVLSKLNPILNKIDDFDAANYYKNFRSFAEHVAKASGGILTFMSIGSAEAKVVDLPMLDEFKL